MNKYKTLALLALGSALLSGCGARQEEPAAEADTTTPAAEMPVTEVPADETYPAGTETLPSDAADPAMSDTLPTTDKPPPSEPPPPPG